MSGKNSRGVALLRDKKLCFKVISIDSSLVMLFSFVAVIFLRVFKEAGVRLQKQLKEVTRRRP